MKLTVKFPSRGRPDKFMDTLKEYYANLSKKNQYEFIISLDTDDPTMNNQRIREALDHFPNLKYFYGSSKNKVQAMNADIQHITGDVIVLGADDMIPVMRGYDDFILRRMAQFFPDKDGVLHFPDGNDHNWRKLNTLPVMGRALFDKWGYIYQPDYLAVWCDNEFQDVTERDYKSVYIPQIVIKHMWVQYTGKDATFARNNDTWHKDKALYEVRKRANFPETKK